MRLRKLRTATDKRRWSDVGILRPFAAIIATILAIVGVVALIVVGVRTLAGRGRQPEPQVAPPAPPPPPEPAPAPSRSIWQKFSFRHPVTIALIVVVVVIVGTLAYIPFAERTTSIGGVDLQPSEYDEFFTYSQMEALTHFAKCDAMLFSTKPEDELENVKERMAVAVDFEGAPGQGPGSREGQYVRRVRSPEEISEAIRLAEEFYERVNCL